MFAPIPISRGTMIEVINATIDYLQSPVAHRKTAIEAFRLYCSQGSQIEKSENDGLDIALRVAVNRAATLHTNYCSEMDPISTIVTSTLNSIQSYEFQCRIDDTPLGCAIRKLKFVRDELQEQQSLNAPDEHIYYGG